MGFSSNKPPYIMQNGGGLEIDIATAAMLHSGHQVEPLYFDQNNLPQALNQDRIDAMGNVHESVNDNKNYYSKPYIYYENYAISHASPPLNISDITDLRSQRIVAWQGANGHLGPQFHKQFNPNTRVFGDSYIEHRDQIAQNRMFWQEKMDIIIVDKLIFEWHRHLLKKHLRTDSRVIYHDIFQRPTRFKFAFVNPQLRNDFNTGLAHIKANGEYQRLYQKYQSLSSLNQTP